MSGGPMPPPPLAWQPAQLYQPNRRCPSETAYALSPTGFFTCVVSCGVPGCSALTRTPLGVALGGDSRKRRSSRLHALITATSASALTSTVARVERVARGARTVQCDG